ncbi:MAG: hypothetical protein ACOH2J_07555 [Allorhizobium sp.]
MSLTAVAKFSAAYILAVVLYASGSTLWDTLEPSQPYAHSPGMMSGVLLAGQ